LQRTRDSLRIFSAAFGPYPFSELDIAQSPNTAGGMEYPGLFAMSTNIWNTSDPTFGFLVVHETAHQWFYSLVGSDQALHPWLDEAVAQYAVAIYIRDMEGEAAYQTALGSFRALYEAFIVDQPDQLIGEPVTAYPGQAYFYLVYQKGPLLYAALDATFGYEAVLHLLRAYCAAYRYRLATPEDALASFESSLGADLHPLFADWVSGGIPVG
jgi:aminopeptidase N